MAETPLERLDDDLRLRDGAERLHLDDARPQEFSDRFAIGSILSACTAEFTRRSAWPINRYLEYSSTTRFSLMSGRISSRSGSRLEHALHFLIVDLDPFREADLARDGQRGLDPQLLFALSRTAIMSPALSWYDGMFTMSPFTAMPRGRRAAEPRRASTRSPSGTRRCRAGPRAAEQVLAGRALGLRGLLVVRCGTAARARRTCGAASASRAAARRSPTAAAGAALEPPGGTSSLHFVSSGFTPLFRNRSVPSRRASLQVGPM